MGSGADWTLHEPDAPVGNDIQNIALQGSRVYIATYIEGVGRFDGTRWRNWFADRCAAAATRPSAPRRYAFALLVDRQGRKWVGNWGSAMESFDDDASPPQFTHYWARRDCLRLAARSTRSAWAAAADSSGGRWFGMDTNSLGEDPTPIGIEYYDSCGRLPGQLPAREHAGDARQPGARPDRGPVAWNLWVGYRGKGVTVFSLPETPRRLALDHRWRA